MRVDMHAHVIPQRYAAAHQGLFLRPATVALLSEMMDRFEIDAAVLSTGAPGAQTVELARDTNEELAEIVREQPARFAALGLLPLPDVEGALAELERALDELLLDGVTLFTNIDGTYLGDPAWEQVMAELDRRRAYVLVHPYFPTHALPLPDHPIWVYEFAFETMRAIANLIYSGTLERYPNVRFQCAHLGGTAPFLAHRLAMLADHEPERAVAAPAGVFEYLRRLYYDTGLANSMAGIVSALEVTSPEHVVFATDWPYAALPREGSDPAPGLVALGEVRARIESSGAAELVPRLVG